MVDILKETQMMVRSDNPASVSSFTTFEELGFDSLDVLEFVAALEQKFGVSFDEIEFQPSSIGEIVSKIEKLLSEKSAKK